MRRIIENYPVVLGGLRPDDIVAKFEGREAQICRSLFSWTHDGSHTAHDEITSPLMTTLCNNTSVCLKDSSKPVTKRITI